MTELVPVDYRHDGLVVPAMRSVEEARA